MGHLFNLPGVNLYFKRLGFKIELDGFLLSRSYKLHMAQATLSVESHDVALYSLLPLV